MTRLDSKRSLFLAAVLAVSIAGLLSLHVRAQSVSASAQLTITSATAVSLTGVSGSSFCRGLVEGSAIRLALDGGTATATVGRPVYTGERIFLNNAPDVAQFSAISMTSTNATISMYCGKGNVPAVSTIEPSLTNTALPLCNALTRPAGNCR